MKTSDDIKELAIALNKCQAEMEAATKDSQAHKYRYSDLSSVWEVVKGPLTSNGLSVWQDVHDNGDSVSVTTRIVHVSGQWVEHGPLTVPTGKRDAHSTGSSATYGRRYGLCAALCVITEDDDGQAAQKAAPEQKLKQKDVNPVRWTEWAMQQFPDDNEMIDTYLLELEQATGKARNTLIQLLGQDDDVFKAKFKLWLNDRGGDDAQIYQLAFQATQNFSRP